MDPPISLDSQLKENGENGSDEWKKGKGNGEWALGNTNNVETEMNQMRKKISTKVN
jgi:hypothetical protein